ncbi:MAG: TM0996/MTH895 family glutaredoxin-like protein [Actinobacteria bacterium]|nr:TM0996/MTH895 family glutaredoxin-like protein [Actinomycetota bacterium]
MQIKVLGAGCANCHTLEDRTREAVAQAGLSADVEMVTDYGVIAGYGVLATPALVIDETVVFSGRVPDVPELVSIVAGRAG